MSPSIDTRQRILDSARELIYARSYSEVGVAEICQHAGVRKGSFYHFFPSKRDLTLAVLDAYYHDFKNDLLDQAFSRNIPPLQRLEKLADLAYRFQRDTMASTGHMYGCPFGNLAVEMSSQDETIRHKVSGIFDRLRSSIQQTLVDAVAAGDIESIDVDATAEAMLAYFEGVMILAKSRNDPELLCQLLPGMTSIRLYPETA